jgi:hypothetical protein
MQNDSIKISPDEIEELHSADWTEDGRTLLFLFDLKDGSTAAQVWTLGQALSPLVRVSD